MPFVPTGTLGTVTTVTMEHLSCPKLFTGGSGRSQRCGCPGPCTSWLAGAGGQDRESSEVLRVWGRETNSYFGEAGRIYQNKALSRPSCLREVQGPSPAFLGVT